MPERATCRERLIAGAPINLGGFILLPIGRLLLEGGHGRTHAWLAARVDPLAVVVRDTGGIRVIAIDAAAALSIDALRERLPELDAALSLPAPARP